MLVGAAVSLLPQSRDLVMVAWAPGIVFEMTIGVWLLLKGLPPSATARSVVGDPATVAP